MAERSRLVALLADLGSPTQYLLKFFHCKNFLCSATFALLGHSAPSAVAKHASDSSQELRPASSLSDSMIMGRQWRLPCMDCRLAPLGKYETVVTKVAGLAAVGTKQQQGQCYSLKQILPPGAADRGTSAVGTSTN